MTPSSAMVLAAIVAVPSAAAFAPITPDRASAAVPFRTTANPPVRRSAPPIRPIVPSSGSPTALHGIPKMFRWLTDQYPSINKRLNEGLTSDVEVDNFYLDMNGIIHPCTHGNNNDEIVVLDETAMFKKIFGYVDRLYRIVKPRKVLYLAVDGVAPRAKMNQQRARRFRSTKEAEELAATILARDGTLPDGDKFDSNCITPGTDFMLKLSLATRKWVEYKQATDPFWMTGADVVFTGPDVPGEGEHKVMDYIRDCRAQYDPDDPSKSHPHWEPGLTHVLFGLDADLIMLGLVTHEPRFLLLREKMSVVMAGRGRHRHRKKKDMLEYTRDDFELLELQALRQMFQVQFRKFADREVLKTKYDIDRIIDDFVAMCMMVGNDFLPHCPHLEIDGGALSLLLNNYIDLLPEWGGYLTDQEKIHPERLEHLIYHLAAFEEEHFKRRSYEENEPGWALSSDNEQDDTDFYGRWYGGEATPEAAKASNRKPPPPSPKNVDDEAAAANKAEKKFHKRHPLDASRSYRDYYYETKMGWSPLPEDRDDTLAKRRGHVRDYLEGLHWNLAYYHRGCASWDWYFPHLYSPLATDMVNLHEFYDDPELEDGKEEDDGFRTFPFGETTPFPSLAQLLSVLPPQSANLLPEPLAELMLEPSSPIAEYYPQDFTSDPNGKRQPWEAVVQIPFIEADTLLGVVNSVLDHDKNGSSENSNDDGSDAQLLTNAERRRNVRGESHTYVPPRGTLTQEQLEQVEASFADLDRKPPQRRGKVGGGGGGSGRGGRGRGGRGRGRGGRGPPQRRN